MVGVFFATMSLVCNKRADLFRLRLNLEIVSSNVKVPYLLRLLK